MSGNLVIVESPAKAKTIERYLGPGYTVLASYGHVRDLPENPGKNQLGVDVEHDFAPVYEVVADRESSSRPSRRPPSKADLVYLATDLDREGEAIAWHVAEAAQLAPERTRRVTFSEITEAAIKRAFAEPRSIDRNLVDAQQARRVVDRLVGYTLSPLLWRKVRAGLSAGRVQSVAVRLVVDREREIRAFTAREYWTLKAVLVAPNGDTFEADLVRIGGKKPEIGDGETAERHAAAIRASRPIVTDVSVKKTNRTPAPPFTTSSLQQEASRKLGFSPKRTMSAAQRLYEGVETDEGQVGLITYMRTDSVALSSQAMAEAARVIESRFGPEYTTPKGRAFKTKTRNAQEAHEAIRPTSFHRDPDALAQAPGQRRGSPLPADLAAGPRQPDGGQGAGDRPASISRPTATSCGRTRRGPRSTASRGSTPRARTTSRKRPSAASRRWPRATPPASSRSQPQQHFTEPPPRYTEASLIKALEEHGIGRPSTYAATISTILDRGYVKVQERRLHPEPVGEIVTDLLVVPFRRVRRPRVHGPDGRRARRRRRRQAGLGPGGPRVLHAVPGAHRGEDQGAAPGRLHDPSIRRGLLGRPSHGHPARPLRRVPGLLDVPRAQGDARAARRVDGNGAEPGGWRGRGRSGEPVGAGDLPQVRRDRGWRAGPAARPVRAVHGLLALPRLRLHQEGRPAASGAAGVRGRRARPAGRATW